MRLTCLILALVLAATATAAASATETSVLVRALSRDAKLIGDTVGGARITVEIAATGELLASGVTAGATGNTQAIMQERRGSSTDVFDSSGAAGFLATFELAQPTLVRFTAEGPLNYPWASATASKTLLVTPGVAIGGGGLILELHGYIVELVGSAPVDEGEIPVTARVRMLCSCPTEPGGLWEAGEVTARLMRGSEVLATTTLAFTGETSHYGGTLPLPDPGDYHLEVLAASPATENFGRVRAAVRVAADGSISIEKPES